MTKYLSVTDTAKLVRSALKAAFPGVKFSVRSDSYSGGASINISWTDGPTEAAVDKVADRYQGCDFDGMQDLKTYRDGTLIALPNGEVEEVRFGANYVMTHRKLSDAYLAELEPHAARIVADNGAPAFSRDQWYSSIATGHGVFPNGSGHNLLWYLSKHIAPSSYAAATSK